MRGKFKCICGWKGNYSQCETKIFGGYCGKVNEPPELWGWEEWNGLACPKCGKEIKE